MTLFSFSVSLLCSFGISWGKCRATCATGEILQARQVKSVTVNLLQYLVGVVCGAVRCLHGVQAISLTHSRSCRFSVWQLGLQKPEINFNVSILPKPLKRSIALKAILTAGHGNACQRGLYCISV